MADGILDEFDASVDRLLTERGRGPDAEPKDLLARLIAARDSETGGGMTAQEVRDQVVTIFMAGHETTAQALAWTWYLLSQHPAVEAKLHAELASVLEGGTPRHEDVANLPYSRMVLEEAMRLYPPAHTLGRQPIAADEVLGHRIPAGSTVLVVPWMLHRKPSLWERPDRFEPERFSPERAAARPRFTLPAVRRRPAHLHRRGVRHGGRHLDPGDDRTALSPAPQARPSGRAARPDHDQAALRAADDPGATKHLKRPAVRSCPRLNCCP